MQFRAELTPAALPAKIKYGQKLFLIGSCFTEEVGSKLIKNKFEVMQNPAGILFNPISIFDAIQSCVSDSTPDEQDILYHNELWHSWKHHSRFSHPAKEAMLAGIRKATAEAHEYLSKADWVMITLGSAFVYERLAANDKATYSVVANCHKVPPDKFHRRLLSVEEVGKALQGIFSAVRSINATVKFILTISPVRHLREGFIDNNRSKAALIQAVHGATNNHDVLYFPSYELVIDDLRDYRFYAEDLAHPNYAATQYVWEKFVEAAMDEASKALMKEINRLNAARSHKPFHPASEAHKRFLRDNLQLLKSLREKYPFLNLEEEAAYFNV